jgi:hypothetical protein
MMNVQLKFEVWSFVPEILGKKYEQINNKKGNTDANDSLYPSYLQMSCPMEIYISKLATIEKISLHTI